LIQHFRSGQSDDIENSLAFEILGFDVMLDDDLNSYLIEVNHTASFATDSPLDLRVKRGLINDTLNLLNLSKKRKAKYIQERNSLTQERILTGKKMRLSPEEREDKKF
jgi:tubulin polyglutamylase TTLL6/13